MLYSDLFYFDFVGGEKKINTVLDLLILTYLWTSNLRIQGEIGHS